MTECAFYALSAAVAWGIALCYIRTKPRALFFYAALAALLCGMGAACLRLMQVWEFLPLCTLVAFLLAALAVQPRRHGPCGDMVLAVLLAQGACMLFHFAGKASGCIGAAGYLVAGLFPGIFAFLTLRLKSHFPEEDWREYDGRMTPEAGRLQLKLRYSYWIAAALCLMLTAGAVLSLPGSLSETLVWSAVGTCFYWFGILLMVLMYAYKKERFAVLVEQQYRGELQSFMNVIRSQRHDYNFHVQTIAGLIRKGKFEECEKYVSALEEDVSLMNAVLPVRDPAVSAMIHNFQMIAAREGIELHIDIQNDLAQIATGAYETNKIISNLLQNAIDETAAHEDKSYGIELSILKRGEYCVIRVSNALGEWRPTAEELGHVYQQGYTTKPGHEGVGLSSIRLLASRYHGTVFTQLEGNIIHFIAKIPIDYAKEPAMP